MLGFQFYPTPTKVIESMGFDPKGKIVLEPSAGNGAIVKYCKRKGAKEVYSCEIDKDLAAIVAKKSTLLCNNFLFLKAEDLPHVDMIVMNPPFWNAAEHIMHAYKIAPAGCEIFALMNAANWKRDDMRYQSKEMKELSKLPHNRIELGKCFKKAKRMTDVDVVCIELKKPESDYDFDYSIFTDEPDEMATASGIVRYNEIVAIVGEYVQSCQAFDKFKVVADELNDLNHRIGYKHVTATVKGTDSGNVLTKHLYMFHIQKLAWGRVFDKMKLEKYLTSSVMKKVNAFSEQCQEIPFTVKNVWRMIDVITGTAQHNFNESLVSSVDEFTRYTKKNRHGLEGWKTNAGHLLNQRFILNRGVNIGWSGQVEISWDFTSLDDLTKTLCWLTGDNYDRTEGEGKDVNRVFKRLYDWNNSNTMTWGQWHEWNPFFEIRPYKRGTLHVKFRDKKDWDLLNRKYAKIKGQVLPEKL